MCYHLTSSNQYFYAHLDMKKTKAHKPQHKRQLHLLIKVQFLLFCQLKVYLFDILLGRVYKKIPEATYTYIYCTSVKDYSLNLIGNVEVTDLINVTVNVTQLTKLLSEPAWRLIKHAEIDYNFTEVEEQCLFGIAGKRFIKKSGSLKGSSRAFICYDQSESKKLNPAPFIEGTHFHFAIFQIPISQFQN